MPSGGARSNCGRPALGKVGVYLRLRDATISKIDGLRKAQKKSGQPLKTRAEVVDEWASGIAVPGLEYLELCPVVQIRNRGNSRGCPRVE